MPRPPEVRVIGDAAAAVPMLLDELRALLRRGPRPLLGLATGRTFAGFLPALAGELAALPAGRLLATHLDEYVDFGPERAGGMVRELLDACAPLRAMLAAGTFLAVPHRDDEGALRAHERRLAQAGGVGLQLLGIGRNGHLAFNEPGAPFDGGFHVATLAASTREDARARFAPAEPPDRAVTAGLGSIAGASRLVVCAFGAGKAAAVHAMLHGPIGPHCPATLVRTHGDVLVLLDPAAAAGAALAPAAGPAIRAATAADAAAIADVLRAAFPTDVEARLVELLRSNGRAVVELVAVVGQRVVCHVLGSPVNIDGRDGGGIGLGALAVRPEQQRRGIGSALLTAALDAGRARGAGFVVLLGDPRYYARFGFTRADARGLGNEYGAGAEFQVLELRAGALPAGGGLVRYAEEFGRFTFG